MDDQTQPSTQPTKGLNPMLIVGVILLVLLIGGGLYFGMKKSSPTKQTVQQMATPTTVPTTVPSVTTTTASPTAMTTAQAKEFTVHGGSYYFKPTQITVKKGDSVKITFMNDAGFHDFVLDGYNVKTDVIGTGKSQTVTFTADKVGSFPYYCSVSNHRAMGMQGTLVVQ